MIENDSALLLVDPWLEGQAFNNGWSLLDQSTSSESLIATLNKSGRPVYIWFSHEHPDHFSIPFLKKFKEQFRGIATFLFQHTLDKRVASRCFPTARATRGASSTATGAPSSTSTTA
jgi:glyoxylase-like metal-dependent hydrolase (beta-lactamase superfamily II)